MQTAKNRLREQLTTSRAEMSSFAREQAAGDLAEWMYSTPFDLGPGVVVASYVPVGREPGSPAMLDALLDQDVTVLLPIVPIGDPGPLDWARYDGEDSLAERRWGLLEPVGAPLGTGAVTEAAVILVPALAVDRTGVRLGRGAGYYDRSLTGASGEVVGVVYDDEVVGELPAEPHDRRVDWVLTPADGFRRLPL